MIKKLSIENFRSIRSAEFELDKLNAIIGPNNSGKSNIMRALNLVLGEIYPSVRSFEKSDFHNYDERNRIRICVHFDSALSCNSRVYGFQLTFNRNNLDYLAIDENGDIAAYSTGREIRISNEMKEEVALMYLGLERYASQQLRATQWTLYGKLLRHIEGEIDEAKKTEFKQGIHSSYSANISPDLQQMEELLKTHVKRQTGLELNLRLSILDPIEIIRNLRPYLKEGESPIEFDAEDMGAGTQSALAVAIARAYAEIVRRPLVIAIEEPELYLHPHGCRHFYELLKELSEHGVQVIYTTHERSFVDISNFRNIVLIRKETVETTVHTARDAQITSYDDLKIAARFNDDINEVFFATHVILVEDFPDKIACQLALEKFGVELNKEGISIIECRGNKEAKLIGQVLRLFRIPVYALLDEDPGNVNTQRVIAELDSILGRDCIFLQRPNLEGIFGLARKPTKAEALDYFPRWFENKEPPNVYVQLRSKL